MAVTRQQLTVESFRELWKNEFFPEIKKEITSANASLHNEIRDLNKRLVDIEKAQSFISEKYDQLLEITKVTKMQLQQVENKLKDQAKSIANLKSSDYDNMVSIDELQQYQRRDCLEIIGIPSLPNDKPNELVKELGSILGVAINDNGISTARRLPFTKKIQDRIIVKFVWRDKREEIYKARKLLLGKLTDCLPSVRAEIGKSVSQPTKVFINESLTAYRRSLFGKIQAYRRQFKFKFIWTTNGKILLRKSESSPVYSFTTEEEFQKFIILQTSVTNNLSYTTFNSEFTL